MAAPDVLGSTGRELMRSRLVNACEAAEMAKITENSPACIQSDDWRVKLGAAGALSLQGAPALWGCKEIRRALGDESSRPLVLETFARSQPSAAISNFERTAQLLRSEDWRLRLGAIESLARHPMPTEPCQDFASALALCCVARRPELRRAAAGVLRRVEPELRAQVLSQALEEPDTQEDLMAFRDGELLQLGLHDISCRLQRAFLPRRLFDAAGVRTCVRTRV
eukprot:g31737.t1